MDPSTPWMERFGKIGTILLATLLIILLYLTYHAGRFKDITNPDAMDAGQLARNLSEGHGYTTNIIRPLSLAKCPQIDRHPELLRPPLHPYIASVFMRLMPDKGKALALSCGMGFLLTAPIIFFLGWQLFDVRTGALATALFATNLVYLQYAISGLEVTWCMFWIALLFLICYNLSRKQRWRAPLAVAAGVVMALLYLTQYIWIVVFPLIAIYVVASSDKAKRWHTLMVFVIAFAIVIAPWCIRNAKVAGNPFFTLRAAETIMGTRSNPGNTLYRQFTSEHPTWLWYLLDRPMEIAEKLRTGLFGLYPMLANLAGLYVTPFFLVAIVVALGARTFERLRYLLYAMFLVLGLALAVTSPAEYVIAPLAPLAIVVAAGFFLRLVEARIGKRPPDQTLKLNRLAIGILMFVHVLPLGADLFQSRGITDRERVIARNARASREVASVTGGPIITDVPWLIAWYTDQPAIWLPKTRVDLRNMENVLGKVRWMLLTPQVGNQQYDRYERMIREWGPAWREGLNDDVDFEGYIVTKRIADGSWVLFGASPRAERELPPDVVERYRQSSPDAEAGADTGDVGADTAP